MLDRIEVVYENGVLRPLHRADRIDAIVTADRTLDEVAQREGLLVRNPLRPQGSVIT
ncbi:MAG: antitoxin family protein [Pirellulaceae bacterium]